MYKKYLMPAVCLLLLGEAVLALPVGSVAIYSDGSVEKLLAKSDSQQRWEDGRKRQILRSNNPIVPPLERVEFLGGRAYSQTVSSGDPHRILTQPAGSRVEFAVSRVKHTGETSKRNWECVGLGSEQTKILGKQRTVDKYACERFTIHRKLWTRQFRERREFSYSPELGLVVDLKRQTRKVTSNRSLVTVLPPDKAGYKQIWRALKKLRSGK